MKPWHLLVSFQLFDEKGKQTETGTFEEWWASPKLHKTVYTSPSYNNTEIQNEEGSFKTSINAYAPELIDHLHEQIVHPLPNAKDIDDSAPYAEKKDLSKVPMDCIMLAQPIKNVAYAPFGLFPTYCFDRAKTSLRVSFDNGTMLILRNQIGTFLGHSVAIDESILLNNTLAATAHIDKLSTLPMPVSANIFAAADNMTKVDMTTARIGAAVAAGSILSKVNPIYPERAKVRHISGTVILRALIGTDGRIHKLQLVSVPDPDLAIAALDAVRKWTYKPYLLNGQPVNVDTTITDNFAFGPG